MSAASFAGRPVVIGGGLAGLMTALHLAPRHVTVLSPVALGTEASSVWAQGGVAASVGPDDDAGQHLVDTLAAGDGLCDAAAAQRILAGAADAIDTLVKIGTRFDRDAAGVLRLGLEAAHGRRRIVHASGDSTGREIMRAVVAAVRACPSITVLEGVDARRLLTADGAVTGVLAARNNEAITIATRQVVMATGGIGGLFLRSTNPAGCFGQGLAMAARAGAALADLEFVQFHPTALDTPGTPVALVSEAVRGEGAILVDETGRRFMADVPGAELAPRDVVARALWSELADGHQTFIDARGRVPGGFAAHFPTVTALCHAHGIDPDREPIPVRPAAHYHMGGIAVDAEGRSTIAGLWACGEVSRTGLHGANRLASNSLLEAVVCARTVSRSIEGAETAPVVAPRAVALPVRQDPAGVRRIVSNAAGVLRDRQALRTGIEALLPLAIGNGAEADPALVGLLIAVTALQRRESRGAHFRTDWPHHATVALTRTLTLSDALRDAEMLVSAVAA
ncbi:L-aspartate oxidase [Beijerinckia sp. L45]|uniref:L-aspartate oxidase n=1 Tax=Beijerinckia sp. L45 TaxID=1641855 RepID=UPI00131C00EC|nr:L-aspartate oxidase [Beijerinckia sp. L45]